jgi:hypothetical protein
VDHMYRILGREHEADLEREAAKRRRAAEAGPRPAGDQVASKQRSRKRIHLVLGRVTAFISRTAGVKA